VHFVNKMRESGFVGLKSVAKAAVRSLAVCCVAPLGVSERLARNIFHRDVFFESHGELLSLVPGKIGRYLRNAYYWMTLEHCPLDCCFLLGSAFTHSNAKVGHRVYIGSFSQVGFASIGDDTLLGDHVQILSGNRQHTFGDPARTIQESEQEFVYIEIGANCWIGTNSVVMESLGRDCVIGAGSVVTKPIPDNSLAVGNPARVIREVYPRQNPSSPSLPSATLRSETVPER
jgi:virginiamycin A acetyltransferase